MNVVQRVWKNFGVVGYRKGDYKLDPNHEKTYVPMTLPGDRVWQGYQRWNPVSCMLQNHGEFIASDQVRNPYTTRRVQTVRVNRTSGGSMNHNSIGPTLAQSFTSLFQKAQR